MLVATARCDLACEHCFGPRASDTMSHDLLRRVARQYVRLVRDTGRKQARVYWQGGEVLTLGKDWIEGAADIFREASAEAGSIELVHHLQTNLAAYDSSWSELLESVFGRRVSTSFDYPNEGRRAPGRAAQELQETWLRNYDELLRAGFHGAVIAVVNASSIEAGPREVLDFFFETAGVRDLQVNLPFPSPRHSGGGLERLQRLHSSGALSRFMVGLYHEWRRRHRARRRFLSPYYAFERFFRPGERRRGLPCAWSPDCSRQVVAVGPDGHVGLCDAWVLGRRDRCYGDLDEASLAELLRSPRRDDISARSSTLAHAECAGCPDRSACHGGCPMRALAWLGADTLPDPYCDVYRAMFAAIHSVNGA